MQNILNNIFWQLSSIYFNNNFYFTKWKQIVVFFLEYTELNKELTEIIPHLVCNIKLSVFKQRFSTA